MDKENIWDKKIHVESYLSEEYQELNSKKIIELYGEKDSPWKCYLFTSRLCFYPLSFKDKHLKLWEWHNHSCNLKYACAAEKGKAYEQYFVYYGVAEIAENQLVKALDIVKQDSMNSLLLFTRKSYDLNELLKRYMPNSRHEIDYNSIISTECERNNRIVKVVVGNDGTAINHFMQKE